MSDNTLKLVFYENQYTAFEDGEPAEMTFEELKEVFRVPEVASAKGNETQFFPGCFREDANSKGDASVDSLYLYCLDADGISEELYESIVSTIREERWECFIHSTYSHLAQLKKDGCFRIRVIFTLSRPLAAGSFRLFWSNIRMDLGRCADQTTSAPSKHYLLPSRPPGEEAEAAYIFREFEGSPINVDEMLRRHGTEPIAESEMMSFDLGKEPVSGSQIAEMLKKRRTGDALYVANALKAALGKNTYAQEGQRESTLFEIAGMLANEFPKGSPDDLCEPLRYSVELEERRGGPKFNEFRDKVIRRQRDVLKKAAERRIVAAKEESRIAEKRASVTEYTAETLKPFLEKTGGKVKFEDLKNQLIFIHMNNYYCFTGNGYQIATANSLPAVMNAHLKYRAESHLDFDDHYPQTEKGKAPEEKSLKHLVRDHGDYIREVRYNYSGNSFFDKEDRCLWMSEVKDPRRIRAERVPEVEEWMKAFAGDPLKFNQWEQWLAQYYDTDRALVGLVLAGPHGIGKSAFAEGMGKMFGDTPPCSMDNSMSDFNSQVIKNPLIFADEDLPSKKGVVPTDKLRTLVSSGNREVNRKGQEIVTSTGFVRVIVAIQTMKKFNFGKAHTREDIEAINKRFLFIVGKEEARHLFNWELFVRDEGLIRHAMYLSEKLTRGSDRFGVDTGEGNMVVAGDPVAMSVIDWVLEYLIYNVGEAAEAKPVLKKLPCFVNKGRVFVNVTMLRKMWDDYVPDKKSMHHSQHILLDAVRTLAVRKDADRIRMGSGLESYWELNNDILLERARAMDLLAEDEWDRILRIPYELLFKSKKYVVTQEEKDRRAFALKEMEDRKAS